MTARKSKTVAAAAGGAQKAAVGKGPAPAPAAVATERPAAKAGAQFERTGGAAFRGYDDAAAFNRATIEALLASTALVAKGAEDIAKTWLGFTQRSVLDGTAAAKAIAEAKTLREAVAAQGDYARASFDSLVAESGKVSEISVKVADEALRPIRARVEVAVARMLKTAA